MKEKKRGRPVTTGTFKDRITITLSPEQKVHMEMGRIIYFQNKNKSSKSSSLPSWREYFFHINQEMLNGNIK